MSDGHLTVEIEELRARVAKLEADQDGLCDRRERVAMLIAYQVTGELQQAYYAREIDVPEVGR